MALSIDSPGNDITQDLSGIRLAYQQFYQITTATRVEIS